MNPDSTQTAPAHPVTVHLDGHEIEQIKAGRTPDTVRVKLESALPKNA